MAYILGVPPRSSALWGRSVHPHYAVFGSKVPWTDTQTVLSVFSVTHAWNYKKTMRKWKLQDDHPAKVVFVDSAERCICVPEGLWQSSTREMFIKGWVYWGSSEGCQTWCSLDKTERTECCLVAATCNSILSFSLGGNSCFSPGNSCGRSTSCLPVCFQLQIQLCLDQVLTLETFLLLRNYITWINLKSLIQQFSDLHTPRTFAAHSFH